MSGKIRVSSLVPAGVSAYLEPSREKTMSSRPALIGGDAVSPDAGARSRKRSSLIGKMDLSGVAHSYPQPGFDRGAVGEKVKVGRC
jgi:hypothetical protein